MLDVIVIGVGSMGSSACYFLAKRGYNVLGIEQFDIPHELGSHTGQSRIIRKAYFEHPDYVPLLESAYKNWKEFEAETNAKIYYETGLVYFGSLHSDMMLGVNRSASLYDVPVEQIDRSYSTKRFTQFNIPTGFETLFEPEAGFVTPEKAIKLYTEQAKKNGASIQTKEKVIKWKKDGKDIEVITDKNIYRCRKLVITAGAWSGKMISSLADRIKVTRQVIVWLTLKNERDYVLNNFPCWMIADDKKPGCYYGFPVLPVSAFGEPGGLKIAYHYPGSVTDPDNVNRHVITEDIKNIEYFLYKYMPHLADSMLSVKTCLYGNSPDENFIIDKLPGYEDSVVVACGFSGHGFKFVSVVGEILADLAMDGITKHPIGFLNARRF